MKTVCEYNKKIIGQTYLKVKDNIYFIFRQACISEDACKDLVQDVFMKILDLDVIVEDHLKGLAVMIAYQKRTDYLRHRSFKNKILADLKWTMDINCYSSKTDVDDILRIESKTINSMSELDQQTYRLSRFEDKTTEETAVMLNITKRAAESRLYRARILVRENIRKAINL